MERLLTLSNGAALHRALKAAGAPVGYRTVARWVGDAPESKPDPELLPYLEAVFGTTKDAAPEGAAEMLLELWTGTKAPPWAQTLTDQVLNAIAAERQVVVDAAIERAVEIAERRLFESNGDEDDPPPPDQPQGSGGSPRAPKA